jgi:hypothetical protein
MPFDSNDLTVVVDADSGRERIHLFRHGTTSAVLSGDGQTLVTLHNDPDGQLTLRRWDLNAGKPLGWPIGIPAGLGGVCVLFAGWRSRRRMKAGGPPCPS